MKTIKYTLELLSDAEPGTGLGGEVIHSYIPRDRRGYPTIPASHLKGVLRDQIRQIEALLPASFSGVETACFGSPGPGMTEKFTEGQDARTIFSDATWSDSEESNSERMHMTVTRTAIDPSTGRASDRSLRTNEVIPVGAIFQGRVLIRAETDSEAERAVSVAIKLALLSLSAIGGGRTRGSGRCLVRLEEDPTLRPGDLLRSLTDQNIPWDAISESSDHPSEIEVPDEKSVREDRNVIVRLVFKAENPVCCPETPVRTGPMKSGFAIPATSVCGMLCTRLAGYHQENSAIVKALLEREDLRTWPLLPCSDQSIEVPNLAKLPVPIHVSLTHKIAKLVIDGMKLHPEEVEDRAIEEVDWQKNHGMNPLKASGGVLLQSVDHQVQLWRAGTMPHVISAHGVHHDPNSKDGRNLYQVDAMAPIIWSGFICLPECVFNWLERSLQRDSWVTFGRSRSVYGLGRLYAKRMDKTFPLLPWANHSDRTKQKQLLIVQSPVLLPVDISSDPNPLAAESETTGY